MALVWIEGTVRRRCQFCGLYKSVGILSVKYISFICKDCLKDASDLIPIPNEVSLEERIDPMTGKQDVRYVRRLLVNCQEKLDNRESSGVW